MRKGFHDNIDKAQKAIDKLDKKDDQGFNVGSNEEVNLQVSYTLYKQIDDFQNKIEADSTLDANAKIKYLRGLHDVLVGYESTFKKRLLKSDQLPDLFFAYQAAMDVEVKGGSILPIINENTLEIGDILVKSFAFQRNPGLNQSKDLLVLKACEKRPERILPILKDNPNISFADSLIKIVARTQQEDIYTYAQSTATPLGRRIHKVDDPLVRTIARLAIMKSGRLYFPFLDNLVSGKITMEELASNVGDENKLKYYKLLVRTQISYSERLRHRDTPMAMAACTSMLRKKAVDDFINVINGLHDSPDNIRMKVVEPLTPQELYYLCVMGETDIYTSSYLKTYERIFQRMKNPNSDSLLMSVSYDHFRKFIKMAANFNTLDDFLKRMDKGNAQILMRAFASGLERTNNLEDAVDVADSYASISDGELRKLILSVVQTNVTKLEKTDNRRASTIYDLMNTIFSSMDSSNKIDLSSRFGIPPIYNMSNTDLRDTGSKRIIIQQFFYSDKDGKAVFNNFRGAYSNANWKFVDRPQWIEVSSTKGIPITIYSNKPLGDETEGLDDKAQKDLYAYLEDKNLQPTVVIHRGHSYHVSSTIKQLAPTAKLVLLGSCGGYHNLNEVLKVSPYAHIIASKQVGSGTVNQPMIISITENLRQGKDLNWPVMWKEFEKQFTKQRNDLFDDYIPPYRNLGALFIMAYNKVMDEG